MELTQCGLWGAPKAVAAFLTGSKQDKTGIVTNGSGGIVMRFFSDTTGGAGRLRILPSLPEPVRVDDSVLADTGVVTALDLIERGFGLNVAQLAEVCGNVTRASVYAWRNGAVPRPAKLARIYDLRRAALNWESSGLGLPGAELRAPVIHQKSLLDLLCAERLDLEAIQFAGERLALKRELSAKRKLADPFR